MGGISEATAVFLAEYERGKHLPPMSYLYLLLWLGISLTHSLAHQLFLAQDEYAHTWAKNALFQMRDDYGEKVIVRYIIL